MLSLISSLLPAIPRSSTDALSSLLPLPVPAAAAGETLASPAYVSAAVLPNGQVGLVFQNTDGIRFKRFTSQQATDLSVQLSTALPRYPQLVTFQGKVIAGYVDTRAGPTLNQLLFRVSTDNGVSWAAEYAAFSATFDTGNSVPLLVTTRDGTRLYVFSCCDAGRPQYRYTQDPTLAVWTGPLSAGDTSMTAVTGSPCGDNSECSRAHTFEFTETATAGQWVYITGTSVDFEHWGCGRGTQVGTLGGSWSAQVGHGTTCNLSGFGGGSRATTFLDRNGNVYYLRTDSLGVNVFYHKSTDGGLTWQPRVYAYNSDQPNYTTGSPVGVYVSSWSSGEYVFWAGFSGAENAIRRIPLWTAPTSYAASGTCRVAGSQGGDCDTASGPPPDFTLGVPGGAAFSPDPVNIATGNFVHHATDLVLPGRLLGLSFTRWYNSADSTGGPLGPAWTHSYNLKLTDLGATVSLRRGDGRVDTYTRNPDLSYAAPVGVFDTLVKNGDATYTLTLTNQVAYAFSSAGALTRLSEPAGNQINLGYTSGNLTIITDSVGRAVALSYDGSSRVTQLQDSIGRKVTYTYDGSGRLATVTDKIGNAAGQNPALHRWAYAYDGTTARLTTITDPDGRVGVTNTYDAQGRVFQQRDGLSALTTFAYTAGQTVLTDPRGNATTYIFDSRFRELSESTVAGGSTRTLSYTYDAAGNRSSVTDRSGKRTDFTFDARGNVLTKTDPQVGTSPRYVTTFQYDSKNNLTQMTDARGFVSTMTYASPSNVLLSLSQQIDTVPTSAMTKWEYGDTANLGLPTRIISPRGNTTGTPDYTYSQSLSYDASGNLVQRIDADSAKTTFGYDGVGRQTSLVDPDGYASGALASEHTWTAAYDENDRVTGVTDPLAHGSSSGYDGAGNRTSATDQNGNVTTYAYDANSRLLNTKQKPDPVGQPTLIYTTSVARDGNGNITSVTQANGVVTDYGFDALNRLTSITTHPTTSTTLTTSYALNGNGLPTSRTTGDGVVVSYAYDELSRLTSVSATGLSTITYAYDELSRRTQMVDGTGTTTYQYDGLSRLTQAAAPNGTLTYGYDRDSNRTSLGYPGAQSVGYTYSPGGRLSSATDWASRATSYSYKASGLVSTVSYPNTMQATYTFDKAQRLTSLTNKFGAATISSHSYALDNVGNRTTLDEVVQGITPTGTTDSFGYSYDGLNRLKTVTGPVAESFVLDAASNLASRTGPTATYSYDTANRLLGDGSQSFTWNAADRLAQRGHDSFTFDALGRLTASQITDDAALSGATWSTTDVPNGSAASLSLNGTTDYAEAPHTPAQNITGDWTIEAWFKDATPGGYNHDFSYMVMKGDTNIDSEAPYFLKIGWKSLSAGVRTAWTSSDVGYDLFAAGVSANAWHHAAATFVSSTRQITLYLDGVQVAQGTVPASSAAGSPKPLSIGRNGTTGGNWNGKLDDIRIWNLVRTATQISTSYQTELSGSPTGLVANWKLDDGAGTVATDVGVARSYTYNGDGLLKSRTEAGATTQLLWNVGAAPAPLLVSGGDRLVHGLAPLYVVRGDNSIKTLATDGLGSVRAELSDAGAVSASFRYAAYGKQVTTPVTPTLLGYAGELGDSGGLLYLRARWYDPTVARFTSRDAAGARADRPATLNGSNYGFASPTCHVDPTGFEPSGLTPPMTPSPLPASPPPPVAARPGPAPAGRTVTVEIVWHCAESVQVAVILAAVSLISIAAGAGLVVTGTAAAAEPAGGPVVFVLLVTGGVELIGAGMIGIALAPLVAQYGCAPLMKQLGGG